MSATDLAAIITISLAYIASILVTTALVGRSIRRLDRTVPQFHDAIDDFRTAVHELESAVHQLPGIAPTVTEEEQW